jgi:hypothetical protein
VDACLQTFSAPAGLPPAIREPFAVLAVPAANIHVPGLPGG